MNNRLDYINKFKPGAFEEMGKLRKQLTDIDDYLSKLSTSALAGNLDQESDRAFQRALSLARTKLESTQMYAIKAMCLLYEDKIKPDGA